MTNVHKNLFIIIFYAKSVWKIVSVSDIVYTDDKIDEQLKEKNIITVDE